MNLTNKDLLGLKDLPREEIGYILSVAGEMKKILKQNVKKTPHLLNKSVVTLFYENSTRTRTSFELSAKFMGASVSNISVSTSSVKKGESLIDTGKTLDALCTDVIIIRHSMTGAPRLLADNVRASVINGGDGTNEHPTQALLDMFTMLEKFNSLKGLKVAIVGDIKHSRVARSNIWGLTKSGAEVILSAPYTLLPADIQRTGVKVITDADSAVKGADVVMGLRLQLERQQSGLFPSINEYHELYGLNEKRIALASNNAIIMHPGPVNRGYEMSSGVIDGAKSVINEQVLNGVAVRMAILFLITRGGKLI
ncbi:MAG: aspartate carbamoyltransferase catalytic subunit [Christensenellales bacterium]|jgi:aspartate carbamoyltransferase catalytic subunit